MATVPLSKDILSSTPIQQHIASRLGGCKRFYASPEKDLLSPIKTSSSLNLRKFLDNSDLDNSQIQILNLRNKILAGVTRKLRFVEKSKLDDVDDCVLNDSGIESENNLSTSNDLSLLKSEISFYTDENCNFTCDNYSNQNSFSHVYVLNFNEKELINSKNNLETDNKNETKNFNEKYQNVVNLDILRELNIRNCYAVLSLILSNLSNEDLRRASNVNKEWRDIVFSDKEACDRRKAYIKEKRDIAKGPKKENRFLPKFTVERSHKSVFLSVINSQTEVEKYKQPLYFTQSVGRFESFIKEAENLKNGEKLVKCPKCLYPSTVQLENKCCCTRNLCQHIFCQKCLGPHLDNHSCSQPKLNATYPQIKIGSKQSKKNLRRL